MSRARLRAGTARDIPAAAGVWVVANDARRAAVGLPPPGSVESTTEAYLARLAVPTTALVVAEDDTGLVGMVLTMQAVENDGAGPGIEVGTMHVSSVAVVPPRWGTGIGASLVRSVLGSARDLGYERVQLWTHESNTRAQALYRRLGFQPSGRTKIDEADELIGHWVLALGTTASGGGP